MNETIYLIEEELTHNKVKTNYDFLNSLVDQVVSSKVPLHLSEEDLNNIIKLVESRIEYGEFRYKVSLREENVDIKASTENLVTDSFSDVETGIEKDLMLAIYSIDSDVYNKHKNEIKNIIRSTIQTTIKPNLNDMIVVILSKLNSLENNTNQKEEGLSTIGVFK